MQIACNARLCELYILDLDQAKTDKPSYAGAPQPSPLALHDWLPAL